MNRRGPLILAVFVAVAVAAGIWSGDAVSPAAPRGVDAAALERFDAARVEAREALRTAATPRDQRAAARELAGVYSRAAQTLPGQQAPLQEAAGAYDVLATASAAAAYDSASQRALRADSVLASDLRRPAGEPGDPLIPPVLPLVMLAAAAAGGAVSSRRRKQARAPEPPPPEPASREPTWDTPPPFGI